MAGEAQDQDRDVVLLTVRIYRQVLDDGGQLFRVAPGGTLA